MSRKSKDKNRTLVRRTAMAAILAAMAVCFEVMSVKTDGFADWYVKTVYPVLVTTVGRFFNLFPFSCMEMLLYVCAVSAVGGFINHLVRGIRGCYRGKKKHRFRRLKYELLSWLNGMFLMASCLAFTYVAGCGINYSATAWSVEQGITTEKYTDDDLAELCMYLTDRINSLADEVSFDTDGNYVAESYGTMEQEARQCMIKLGQTYSDLSGYYPHPKGVLSFRFMTLCLVTGIYSPFTIEANYNRETPAYELPFTMCHELSHLKGFMREDEANFLAVLGCLESDDADFQFSGLMLAYSYCMNAYSVSAGSDKYTDIREQLDERASRCWIDGSAFWRSYQGTVSKTHEKVNDAYLKANGQSDGQKTYSHVVNLLLSWYDDIR